MSRDSNRAITDVNDSFRLLKQQVKEHGNRGKAPRAKERPAVDADIAERQLAGNAVQLQAIVPGAELKRIAAKRGTVTMKSAGTSKAIENDSDSPAAPAASQPAPAPEAAKIGVLLGSRRTKMVFVIQKAVE